MELKCQFKFLKIVSFGCCQFLNLVSWGPCSINFKNGDLFQEQFLPLNLDLVTQFFFFTFKKPNFLGF